MTDDQISHVVNVQRSERADRILDAAAELVLRHGYRRVTIEDIASRAGIGKGTVYLHWRTREELFWALLTRETIDLFGEHLDRIRADPAQILPHRSIPWLLERSMSRPLLAAMITKDVDVLGKLVEQGGPANSAATMRINREYLEVLRSFGLVRTDMDTTAQLYVIEVVGGGFALIEPWLPPAVLDLPMADKTATVAHLLRAALEPEGEPDGAALAAAAPLVIDKFERMYRLSVDTIHGTAGTEG